MTYADATSPGEGVKGTGLGRGRSVGRLYLPNSVAAAYITAPSIYVAGHRLHAARVVIRGAVDERADRVCIHLLVRVRPQQVK